MKDQLAGLREIDAQAEIIDKSGTYSVLIYTASNYRISKQRLNKMFAICRCKSGWSGRAGRWSV